MKVLKYLGIAALAAVAGAIFVKESVSGAKFYDSSKKVGLDSWEKAKKACCEKKEEVPTPEPAQEPAPEE